MQPLVATGDHVALAAGALEDDDVLDAFAAAHERRLRRRWLERDVLAAAELAVGSDQHDGAGVVDAVAQRLGREAAEDDRVDGADAGAGLHGDDAFDRHRQVDDDAVALLDTLGTQQVGHLADLGQQVLVGDRRHLAVVGFENDGDLVAQTGFDIAVEAVVGHVELAVGKPLEERCVGLVEDLGKRLLPADHLPCTLGPETLVVGLGFGAQRLVGVHPGNRRVPDGFVRRVNQFHGFTRHILLL
jgi:hypothetical protein